MKRLLALLLLGLAGASVAGQSTTAPAEAPSQAEAAEVVNALLGGLLGAVDGPTLQREVEDAGGIKFKRDVPIAFLGRAELGSFLRELFDAEYPATQARADERLLQAFDLLPAATDLRALRARVLEENIVGFYDDRPDRRRLYAVSEEHSLTPINQIVLAHELRHALQDQYSDVHAALSGAECDFDDRRLAVLSLYEGDATLVMERFLRARLGPLSGLADLSGAADEGDAGAVGLATPGLFDVPGAPPVVRDQLVQPYLSGLVLARALWTRGGAAAMREAWANPPASTEQVLHPELFLRREAPRAVSPRLAPPAGATLVSEGVLGELLLRTLLDEEREAAAGWGGDAWRLWDLRGRTVLAWRSEWDTLARAVGFHAALRQRFSRRHGQLREQEGWQTFEAPGARWFAMRREQDAVELVTADDAQLFATLLRRDPRASETLPGAGPDEPTLDIGVGDARVPDAGPHALTTSRDVDQGGLMATSTPPGNQTNLGMAPNVAGLLCYVPCCIGLVFSVVAAIVEKQSRFVRFHAFQSLLLHGAAIAVGVVLQIFTGVLTAISGILGVLVSGLLLIVGLGFLGLTIFLMIKANAGEELELPVIGPMARQWV